MNLRKILLTFFCVLSVWISHAQNIIVSGAGTSAVNGTYVQNGTSNGKPLYEFGTYRIQWMMSYWTIIGGCCADYYLAFQDVATPDLVSFWDIDLGSPPHPTVSVAGPAISYSGSFLEKRMENDGSISSSMTIIHNGYGGDFFTGSNGDDFVADNKVTITNLPSGLTPVITRNSNTSLTFTLTGNASSHSNSEDLTNLSVEFLNAAFDQGNAAAVTNYNKSDIAIEFIDHRTVGTSGEEFTTIGAGITGSEEYDVLSLAAETFTELNLFFGLNKNVWIYGQGASQTIIQAHANPNTATSRVFHIGANVGQLEFRNLTLRNGKASDSDAGGCIYSNSPLYFLNCDINNNIFVANTSSACYGGAIAAFNGLTMKSCLISNNTLTDGGYQQGGAIYAAQTSNIENCTFVNNSNNNSNNQRHGGAIFFNTNATSITNCTFSGNSVSPDGTNARRGGAIYQDAGTLELINNIIYNNTANEGSDFYRNTGTTNAYHNIIGSGTAINGTNTNNSSTDPNLQTLADNGGPTQTIAILTGSAAKDAGYATGAPVTDQRGYQRDGSVDIGAFEFGACDRPSISTSFPSSRCNVGSITISATPSAGIIKWYNTSSGGAALTDDATYDLSGNDLIINDLTTTTTFYAEADNTGCLSASRTAVIATINPLPGLGSNWESGSSAWDGGWRSVAYGNGVFVAVSSYGSGNRVMTSTDGKTWTSQTSAVDNEWYAVTFGNGLFVAVSRDGSADRVMTSPDGIAWTTRADPAIGNNEWSSITYGNSMFVAVASSSIGVVMTSPDGINWSNQTAAANLEWRSVTYGNGVFVAVASNGTGNRVMTSADGITWTSQTSAADNTWYSVTFGNGLFVAVSTSGFGNRVMTSADGITWTSRTSAVDNFWRSVTYGNGLFVAVSTDGSGNRVMTSPDGINWTSKTSASDNVWTSVAFGDNKFVAVSLSGAGNRAMVSSSAPTGTASQTFCTGKTVADLIATGDNIQWYIAPSGGSPLASGTALANATNYYATKTVNTCESYDRFAITTTLNALPNSPTAINVQAFCGSGTVDDLSATGSAIKWYSAPSGGTNLAGNTNLLDATVYYASQTVNGCESSSRINTYVQIGAVNTLSGSGTAIDPYLITSKADLKFLSDNTCTWNKHYKQTVDITFIPSDFQSGGDFYYGGLGFNPIGYQSPYFTGNYDGQGNSISGLTITDPTGFSKGLFGTIYQGTISNINVENVTISGGFFVGALAGNNQGTITNCSSSGTIAGNQNAGGLLGDNNGVLSNSTSSCALTSGDYIGGLVGRNWVTISNCSASGNVSGGSLVGGLIGRHTGGANVTNSFANGNVTGTVQVGGFTGSNSNSTISKCYATGNVTCNTQVGGGFAGDISGTVSNCYASGNVSGSGTKKGGFVGNNYGAILNSYSTGNVTGGSSLGGFSGLNSSTITNCFYNNETSGQTDNDGRGVPKTTTQLTNQSTFTIVTWDFVGEPTNGSDDIWKMGLCSNSGYPIFSWQTATICPEIKPSFCGIKLVTLTDQLIINATPSATNYEYEAFDGTNTLTWTKNSGLLGFKMSNFVGVKYNTTYQVKVRAFVGSWQSWGAACNITTPETKVRDNFCSTTLSTMEDQLMIYAAKDATNYEFEANDGTNPPLTWIKGSGLLGFKMSNFLGVNVNTSYQVKVRAFIGGVWKDWGATCQITTPNKHIRNCGTTTLSTMNDQLLIYGQEGATDYEYEANDGTNAPLTWLKGSALLGFKMSNFPGVLPSTSYQVKVRAINSGIPQAWGDACTIITPASKVGNPESNEINEVVEAQDIELSIYPNPNNGAFTISSTYEGSFQITNELGQIMLTVEPLNDNKQSGVTSENFQTLIQTNLKPGVYFVTATANNEVVTTKIVVQ